MRLHNFKGSHGAVRLEWCVIQAPSPFPTIPQLNQGALSTLSELRLEQLYFIMTGLSPLIHVKDLIVENRSQL